MKIVIATGGFDPLHSGHIAYLTAAAKLGDMLIVGLNSDAWLARKKSQAFMPMAERKAVVSGLKMVDQVIEFNDDDDTACDAIRVVRAHHHNNRIVFANGGDRKTGNTPETIMSETDHNLYFAWGVGGENKANSSSWILNEWKNPKTDRQWGYYRVLHQDGRGLKLKELTVEPGKTLSMQKHKQRSEFWFVAHGQATVYTINPSSDIELSGKYEQFQSLWIHQGQWHQLANETNEPLRLVEIQYGENCIEDDIIRK